ncbi:MAG: SDR family NAD(P)-dependent oxidoreductase [Tannerellaceae bacterium]|jgi:NAD(P)-dependent dehydrogenase (short-subunit alcohol dehydrogenase family)|nr:SDR family NAD(P)-dependent oxidoreductase [Tannerellaceae bacterium]
MKQCHNGKRVVFITGASSGIGRATALLLAKHNYTVYGAARRIGRLKELESQGVKPIVLDVTDEISVGAAIDEVIGNEGRIDVLINNAGYGEYGAIEDVSMKNARKQMDVNLFGLARVTQLIIPHMRKQKSGKIVNITSIGGKVATPMGGWYYASKFAVEGLSDSLRLEVRQFGIDVILIEPGGIKTEWGGIANDTMMKASGDSAYSHFAKAASKATSLEDKLPEPTVIAELIKKAIEAKKPKTRYVMGFMAKPILFVKKLLSDALFDKVILNQFK